MAHVDDKAAGFWTFNNAEGVPVLKYRPKAGGKLETVEPFPDRNNTSYVHRKTGAMIDLALQTPAVTSFATEDDVAVVDPPKRAAENDNGRTTHPPVQS